MLLPMAVGYGIMFGVAATMMISSFVLARRARRGSKGAQVGQWVLFLGAAGVIVAGLIMPLRVYRFTGTKVSIQHEALLLYGRATVTTSKGDIALSSGGSSAWLVNASDAVLTIETARYGSAAGSFGGDGKDTLEPGAVTQVQGRVEYFGPTEFLPNSVQSKSGSETLVHVTW